MSKRLVRTAGRPVNPPLPIPCERSRLSTVGRGHSGRRPGPGPRRDSTWPDNGQRKDKATVNTHRNPPSWLSEAVLYQIYPASFADSDGDGVGDLPGALGRLDHLDWLGVDTLWFSPCFASTFGDGGYDISRLPAIAPRYGTNEDPTRSSRPPAAAESGSCSTSSPGTPPTGTPGSWSRPMIRRRPLHLVRPDRHAGCAPGPRPRRAGGYYLANFYPIQPALNFGYARHGPGRTLAAARGRAGSAGQPAALREIMGYWFDRGVVGLPGRHGRLARQGRPRATRDGRLWREMRDWLDRAYPDAVLLSEWGDPGRPCRPDSTPTSSSSLRRPPLRSLWDNGTGTAGLAAEHGRCYFDADGRGRADGTVPDGLARAPTQRSRAPATSPCPPPTTTSPAWPAAPAPATARAPPSPSSSPGPRCRSSTTATRSACATYPACRTRRAAARPRDPQGSRTPMQWDDEPQRRLLHRPADHLYLPRRPGPRTVPRWRRPGRRRGSLAAPTSGGSSRCARRPPRWARPRGGAAPRLSPRLPPGRSAPRGRQPAPRARDFPPARFRGPPPAAGRPRSRRDGLRYPGRGFPPTASSNSGPNTRLAP